MGAQESCHKSLCLSANADADGNAYLPTSGMDSDLDLGSGNAYLPTSGAHLLFILCLAVQESWGGGLVD